MNADTPTGSLWAKLYTPDGYQISLTLPAATVAEALAHLHDIRAAGLLAMPPDVAAGEAHETIVTCVLREHIDKRGSITPVVDFYPDWRGDYGQYRFCCVYLDTPEMIADFERQSGLRLDDMPVYESQAPLQRSAARRHKAEVACRPFVAVKAPDGEKEIDGKVQAVYRFARYGKPAPGQAANPFDLPAVQAAIKKALAAHTLDRNGGVAFVLANINPKRQAARFSDLHPDMTPDDVLKALPAVAAKYHLSTALRDETQA